MPFAGRCSTDGKIKITLNPRSTGQRPAKLEDIVWSTSGPGTLAPAEDGLSCYVISPDALDPNDALKDIAQITVNADKKIGAEVDRIEETGTVTFFHPEAADFGATIGTEEPKDVVTPPTPGATSFRSSHPKK